MTSYLLVDLDPCLSSSAGVVDFDDIRDARDHVVSLINQRVLPESESTNHVLVGVSEKKDAAEASSLMGSIVVYVNTMEGKEVMKGYVLLNKKRKGKMMMVDGTTPYPESNATMRYLTCRPAVIALVTSWWKRPRVIYDLWEAVLHHTS